MLLVTDVHYFELGGARAAGVLLEHWSDGAPFEEVTVTIDRVEPYVSGAFYRRELPCLLALLEQVEHPLEAIVVDGHVWLGDRPGLGAHLHQATGIPVVGVAKNPHAAGGTHPVHRGSSRVPLHVSAIGLPEDQACQHIRQMAGEHRLPTVLKHVDHLARALPTAR